MAPEEKSRIKLSYLTFTSRALLALLCAFIIKAYFYPISSKFYFTSSDELMHFTGFAFLGFIFALAFPNKKPSLGIFCIVLLGIGLEIAQPLFTLRRELSLSDMIANGTGGLVGYGLGAIIQFTALKRTLL